MKKTSLMLFCLVLASNILAKQVSLGACIPCHGKNFEKKAFNVSLKVNTLTKKEIRNKLKNYRDVKNFGHTPYREYMAAQVSNFKNSELEELSLQISKLKK